MTEKAEERVEMEGFLQKEGYLRKIERLKRRRRVTIMGINMVLELEIIPEVAEKLEKDPKEIRELIKSICL